MMLAGIPESAFGFHAQQAAEKLNKALINEHQVKYRHIHEIHLLVGELEKLGEVLPSTPYALVDLSDYARAFVMRMAYFQHRFHARALSPASNC